MTADMQTRWRARGFTLLELMVAFTITGMLLMLGMPSFTTFLRNSEIRSTAESIINGLRTASTEAVRRNESVTFTFAGANSASWTIALASDPTVVVQQYSSREAGSSSKVTITPAAQASVTFTGLGRIAIDPANPDNHIRMIDIDSIVAGEARPLRIVVDDPAVDPTRPRGMRMCDPDPALAALAPPDPRAC